MPVGVVVRLEVIDVEHRHAVAVRVARTPRLEEIEILFERAAIAEPGERVLAGERGELVVAGAAAASADVCTSRARAASASAFDEQVREHRDLRSQLVGRYRREDEVDRALRVEIGGVRSRRCRTR